MQEILKPEVNYYELVELMGEGLSSCVYRALRTDSRQHSSQIVALKLLKSQKHVHLLKNEFQALCQIRSNHCVSVLGWENFEKNSALVLEFVDGISLDQLMRLGQVTREILDEVTRQVQVGLEHLHAQALCHGDLSPGNILIDARGTVKLVDFGLANWSSQENFGTPDFLAPERWQGVAPGYESDLYALGLIRLYVDEDAPATSLMELQPLSRRPLELKENKVAQTEMAQMVQRILQTRIKKTIITQVLHTVPIAKAEALPLSKHVARTLVLVCVFAILLFPLLPHPRNSTNVVPATLEIRSDSWIHAQLNNSDLGYAPIRVLSIYPGQYRLKWQSATAAGTKEVNFAMGEHKVLTEADFLNNSR